MTFERSIYEHHKAGRTCHALNYATNPDEFKLRDREIYRVKDSAIEETERTSCDS